MFGQLIRALIYICFLAAGYYLVIWVLENVLMIAIPIMIARIFGVILVLLAILILYQLFGERMGTYNWWGRRPPQ